MAKKKPVADKPSEKKDAGNCPVSGEACQKDCEPKECSMDILESAQEPIQESSPKKSDLENHPKFDKYKTSGGKPL